MTEKKWLLIKAGECAWVSEFTRFLVSTVDLVVIEFFFLWRGSRIVGSDVGNVMNDTRGAVDHSAEFCHDWWANHKWPMCLKSHSADPGSRNNVRVRVSLLYMCFGCIILMFCNRGVFFYLSQCVRREKKGWVSTKSGTLPFETFFFFGLFSGLNFRKKNSWRGLFSRKNA